MARDDNYYIDFVRVRVRQHFVVDGEAHAKRGAEDRSVPDSLFFHVSVKVSPAKLFVILVVDVRTATSAIGAAAAAALSVVAVRFNNIRDH